MPDLEILSDQYDDSQAFDLGREYHEQGLGVEAAVEDAAEAYGDVPAIRAAAREGWWAREDEEREYLEQFVEYGPDGITEPSYGL